METNALPKRIPPQTQKTRPKMSSARKQALELQRQLHKDALSETVKPQERAALVRAWCDLNEEIRKLSMKPLPKSVDTLKARMPGRSPARAVEPAEPTEPKA